ncbi:MAG: isocitrate dehydrogenase (NADP(+)) [Candidatus Margulisbacteria bacterium GWF2_35_9]|nr:MAG: isocitrate dehydrogenase (NADP(+)) [Candidatus Margulisbacteria bacterium GWF2_35_9]
MSKASRISISGDKLCVPDHVVIPFIEGDGIGSDITKAMKLVVNAAVSKIGKQIEWLEILAGEKAFNQTGAWMPEETLERIKEYSVAIKGPLTTPVGTGIRSLNVMIRQVLDLYACVRPVRYFKGVESPLKRPELLDVVIFRENTEDVYSGIEWEANSAEATKMREILAKEFGVILGEETGIGIKPISKKASYRLMRMAIKYAIDNNRKVITIVHKGNIMKFTEGAFMKWCYACAKEEFSDFVVFESDLNGSLPEGKIVINDRIADSMFQQALLRPDEYEVIVTTNLNGDYLSDACAAEVGGLGLAPGGNIGDNIAVFEATHGTAPKYANQNKINPSSLILSAVMMLDYLGWQKAATLIIDAIEKTILSKEVTYDLARQMPDAKEVSTSDFAKAIIKNMK